MLSSFHIAADNMTNWYTGTGDASSGFLGSGVGAEYDLWSVMSHEFGHATGYQSGGDGQGHFREEWDVCSDDSNRHTMCPSTAYGTEMMRSSEPHDVHTARNAYP